MANEALNKLWDNIAPIPPQQEAEAPQGASVFERLWNKITGPSQEIAPKRDTGIKSIGNSFDALFNNLIMAESGGKHLDEKGNLTTSPMGAQGITQLMPATAKKPGYGIEPVKNASESEYKRVGRAYLQALMGEFGGDARKALAAYNAGPGNVKKAIKEGGADWMNFLPKKEETIPYVNKILGRG